MSDQILFLLLILYSLLSQSVCLSSFLSISDTYASLWFGTLPALLAAPGVIFCLYQLLLFPLIFCLYQSLLFLPLFVPAHCFLNGCHAHRLQEST